jgi:hypothetical protein
MLCCADPSSYACRSPPRRPKVTSGGRAQTSLPPRYGRDEGIRCDHKVYIRTGTPESMLTGSFSIPSTPYPPCSPPQLSHPVANYRVIATTSVVLGASFPQRLLGTRPGGSRCFFFFFPVACGPQSPVRNGVNGVPLVKKNFFISSSGLSFVIYIPSPRLPYLSWPLFVLHFFLQITPDKARLALYVGTDPLRLIFTQSHLDFHLSIRPDHPSCSSTLLSVHRHLDFCFFLYNPNCNRWAR